MRYQWDNDLHIHSKISLCSNDPEQTNERILQYAVDNGLKTLCLTDHYWDKTIPLVAPSDFYEKQDFDWISAAKPLPQAEGVRFLFGCETEMDRLMTIGLPMSRFEDFSFVIVPTTHFHFRGLTIPEETVAPKDKAAFWVKKLEALLDQNWPFYKMGLAHMTCCLIDSSREKFLETIAALDGRALERVFRKAANCGIGIELNSDDMNYAAEEAETVLRPYRIAKEMGCKFYMGSDAHHPKELNNSPAIFQRAIDALELTEEDKFHLRDEE